MIFVFDIEIVLVNLSEKNVANKLLQNVLPQLQQFRVLNFFQSFHSQLIRGNYSNIHAAETSQVLAHVKNIGLICTTMGVQNTTYMDFLHKHSNKQILGESTDI